MNISDFLSEYIRLSSDKGSASGHDVLARPDCMPVSASRIKDAIDSDLRLAIKFGPRLTPSHLNGERVIFDR